MSRTQRIDVIDTADLTRSGGTLSGHAPLERLARLDSMLEHPADEDGVDWTLSGRSEPQPDGSRRHWLSLHFDARLGLTCVRCLQRLPATLSADRRFLLVADEALAARADAESDDFDVLVGSRRFDVLELVEDEVIMELPLVPRHDVCDLPAVVEPAGGAAADENTGTAQPADEAADDDRPPNPFAVLQQLRRKQ